MRHAALVALLIYALAGCTTKDFVMPSPLGPIQVATGLAADIESAYEDCARDAQEASTLEAIADVMSATWWVPWTFVAHVATMGEVIYRDLAGERINPHLIAEQWQARMPMRLHEPDPTWPLAHPGEPYPTTHCPPPPRVASLAR